MPDQVGANVEAAPSLAANIRKVRTRHVQYLGTAEGGETVGGSFD
jgi:hypothetical protein